MSEKRYYTVDEVNERIVHVAEALGQVIRIRTELKRLYDRLDRAGFAPTRDSEDAPPAGAPEDVVRDHRNFQALIAAMRDSLATVQATGGEIKDIETGLVDWLARSGDRDVLLCWRLGEREVAFFHDLHTGFAGRRPIAELAPPDRPPGRTIH